MPSEAEGCSVAKEKAGKAEPETRAFKGGGGGERKHH